MVEAQNHDAAFWSALAGVASAFASALSLIGLRASIRESRRSTDLAEEAARDRIRPLLVIHFKAQAPGVVLIEVRNEGNGPALNIHMLRRPDPQGWQSRYFKNTYTIVGLPLAIHRSQPLAPQEQCSLTYDFNNTLATPHFYLGYTDIRGNPHECRFMVVRSKEDRSGVSLATLGYGEWDFRRDEHPWLSAIRATLNKDIKIDMPELRWFRRRK